MDDGQREDYLLLLAYVQIIITSFQKTEAVLYYSFLMLPSLA